MTEQTMWAVKTPSGRILANTIRESEDVAMDEFGWGCRLNSWKEAEKAGYRCVRVTVREVEL